MINKSTQSILHGLTNGTDVERRAEADDRGIDDGRARRLPSLSPDTSIRSKYRAFLRSSRPWKKTNGRRKDEFEHVICQQAGPVMIMAGLLRVEGSRFRIMLERLELFMIVEQMPV